MTKAERVSEATKRARASIKDAIRIVAGDPATSGVTPSPLIETSSLAGCAAQVGPQAR